MVKTFLYKTVKDFYLIKMELEKIIEQHTLGPLKESGHILLSQEPKLHLFTLAFKDGSDKFGTTINLFNEIKSMKVHNARLKSSEGNYGDIVIYFLPTSEQKTLIEKIISIGDIKRNPISITIGTIKENYNVSMDIRKEGLKILLRKIYAFLKGVILEFEEAKSISF
ncbi:hypothetical protein IIV31_117R [Armadillidium vulgare iridescent virus]|uniref:Uncharacterized protein n=1 Tax=Armadillidium vulgare iridescent virus TaxID=72201 RepID=A0A068QLQ5_9VIRU|nr:hypothetical protein IIV31_117R [Armadillidium vulgare iridescent virus]CCV02489.1 hypothetical protein IIV31_117R [Armadillidium vulgare iridescent virus]